MSDPTPTEYSPDGLCQMLTAGADAIGRTNVQAAVHLLTFTEPPRRREPGSPHVELHGRDLTQPL